MFSLQLLLRRHLLRDERRLDAVEEPLEPTDELRLGEPELRIGGGRVVAEDERQVLELGGRRLGISICEDIWNDRDFWKRRRYHHDPIEEAARAGADTVVTGTPAQHMGQALAEPAFHPSGRHHHEVLRERIRRWGGQQSAETIRKDVGALSAVNV
jgi:hypothetical protein